MELKEVRNKVQFNDFYKSRNLTTTEQKIEFLIKEMGILCSYSDEEFTKDEELSTLQQYALYSWDRQSHTTKKVPA